jgi:hypothetical protein
MSPTCAKCGNSGPAAFAMAVVQPAGLHHPLHLLHCTACGGAVGSHEHEHIGAILHQQNHEIGQLKRQIADLTAAVDECLRRLQVA